jgi:hypothetical protein
VRAQHNLGAIAGNGACTAALHRVAHPHALDWNAAAVSSAAGAHALTSAPRIRSHRRAGPRRESLCVAFGSAARARARATGFAGLARPDRSVGVSTHIAERTAGAADR